MSVARELPVERTVAGGEETGPPVVLLHGFASSAAADWPAARWAGPLARAGRASVAVRLPGHSGGPAAGSAVDVTTGRIVADLAETVRAVATDEVDLVGYSLGARLAWDLASASPVPVRHLVLGGLSPFEPFGGVDLGAARAYLAGGPPPADPLTGMIAAAAAAPGQDGASLLLLVEGLAREPFDPTAKPPAAPTLFLAGTDDPMSQGIDRVAGLVAGAHVARVPGDHLGALASSEFRSAVFGFLGVAGA